MIYRNYVQRRFHDGAESAVQLAGCVHRRLRPGELLSWRQDWGSERSIHPLSRPAS